MPPGLCAEYSLYDGTPHNRSDRDQRHDLYYSDAYRTIANMALDYAWFRADPWQAENAERLQKFFCDTLHGRTNGIWEIDGTPLPGEALHPVAITATNAQASLAAGGPNAEACVRRFWNTPLREGPRRYYDNCLYFFALLALSGQYRIWPL